MSPRSFDDRGLMSFQGVEFAGTFQAFHRHAAGKHSFVRRFGNRHLRQRVPFGEAHRLQRQAGFGPGGDENFAHEVPRRRRSAAQSSSKPVASLRRSEACSELARQPVAAPPAFLRPASPSSPAFRRCAGCSRAPVAAAGRAARGCGCTRGRRSTSRRDTVDRAPRDTRALRCAGC